MAARIIDGKAVAADVRAEVAERVRSLVAGGLTPGLAAVLVGDDPASHVYVRNKLKAAEEVGFHADCTYLPETATPVWLPAVSML